MTTRDPKDASEVVLETVDCPNCKGRKKLTRYADGHGICYNKGCGYKEGTQPPREKPAEIPAGLIKPDQGSYSSIRRINPETLRRYGAFLGAHAGQRQLVVPIYQDTGEMIGQQLRAPDGTVSAIEINRTRGLGSRIPAQLLGQHVFGDRNDLRVVIHSDATDMMSTAQVTRLRMPSVAVLSAHSALGDIKANYRWLDRYGEIILFFQESPEWQKVAQECAALFGVGKVKIALMGEFKSSNEALQQNQPGDIESAIYAATVWRPTGIVNAKEGLQELLEEGLQVPSWPYPWPMFNEKSLGMRPGEVVYHVGGTGIAKTTLMFHYCVHLLGWDGKPFLDGNYPVQPKPKVGWLGFEDMTRQVKLGLLSIHAGQRLHLEPVSNARAKVLYDELFGDARLEMYDPENAEYSLEAIKGYIRFMAKALDCKVIFVDPLTFLVSMLPPANRTAAEEGLAAWLAAEAKALGICIHIGYHLRKPDGTPFEEGGAIGIPDIKGAGALVHYAHAVFGYERDQQGDRPDLLRVRAVKAIRFTGYTGVMGILKYDLETGRYTPTEEKWPEKDDSDDSGGGFSPVSRKASTANDGGSPKEGDY